MMTRPKLTLERINEIQTLIADNPSMGRTEISRELCRIWGWQSPRGQLKDISARDMLRALDKAGKISLPAAKSTSRRPGQVIKVKPIEHNTEPICGPLRERLPIRLDTIENGAAMDAFKSYINQYHYLGFDRTVGENIKYMATDHTGTPLACLLFGSAAWACADRDGFIGWSKEQRAANLTLMTNNIRFLVFPWIQIPYLASHVLALVARRISADWTAKYGHSLACLETFVETGRFRGTCYKAANWINVGRTQGRGRDGGHHCAILPVKDIYLYPLCKDYLRVLRGEQQ